MLLIIAFDSVAMIRRKLSQIKSEEKKLVLFSFRNFVVSDPKGSE